MFHGCILQNVHWERNNNIYYLNMVYDVSRGMYCKILWLPGTQSRRDENSYANSNTRGKGVPI